MRNNTEGFIELCFPNKNVVSVVFQTAQKFGGLFFFFSPGKLVSALTTMACEFLQVDSFASSVRLVSRGDIVKFICTQGN